MNVNSHSKKLDKDWPDRFELFTSIDPYASPWCGSYDNSNSQKPYFSRGGEFDPDNGAIWAGEIYKYRNNYFIYYENYHSIDNVNKLYEKYNDIQSGSRLGFATGN